MVDSRGSELALDAIVDPILRGMDGADWMASRALERLISLSAVLPRVSQSLQSPDESEGLLKEVVLLAKSACDADEALILLSDQDGGQLRPFLKFCKSSQSLCRSSAVNEALRSKEPRSWSVLASSQEPDEFMAEEHVAAIPLVYSDNVVGVLVLVRWSDEALAPCELELARTMVGPVASALECSRLLREAQNQARTDPLTGLNNRRNFLQLAERELKTIRRYGYCAGMIMVDVDHFKQINDHYGHAVGDRILFGVANRLQRTLREVDVLAR